MKQTTILLLLIAFVLTAYGQDFKLIKPNLTDSTKVVKKEISDNKQFERIYFIDHSKNSKAKAKLADFYSDIRNPSKDIEFTYSGIVKNLETKPTKFVSKLPEKWVKLFKYKGEWILFYDLSKYILTDSSLISFGMEDPTSSVVADYKFVNDNYAFSLLSYNWQNPNDNIKSSLTIKVINPKRMITLWKTDFRNKEYYELMIPVNQISKFPIMVVLETDFMDDETDIFDKIDYEKLWNK